MTEFTYLMKLIFLINDNPELIDKIKEHKDDINKQNTQGWTALMIACRHSNKFFSIKIIRELINCGANMDVQDSSGWTALMMACRYSNCDSNFETVKLLIESGANIDMQDDEGWITALVLKNGPA